MAFWNREPASVTHAYDRLAEERRRTEASVRETEMLRMRAAELAGMTPEEVHAKIAMSGELKRSYDRATDGLTDRGWALARELWIAAYPGAIGKVEDGLPRGRVPRTFAVQAFCIQTDHGLRGELLSAVHGLSLSDRERVEKPDAEEPVTNATFNVWHGAGPVRPKAVEPVGTWTHDGETIRLEHVQSVGPNRASNDGCMVTMVSGHKHLLIGTAARDGLLALLGWES